MLIINDQSHYVIQIPEYGVYQDIDPHTGAPFATDVIAKKWEADFLAGIAAAQAADTAAKQAALAARVRLIVTADKTRAMLGESVTLSVTIKNGLEQVVPLTDDFAVPVEDETGKVILIKHAAFVAGHSTVTFTPTRSGYYCITEHSINRKLPPGTYFGLDATVEITVYE